MGLETHADSGPERAGAPVAPATPGEPAGADILERALRGLKPWVRLAQGGLAVFALLALFSAFRGLSAAQGSPATLQVGTLAVLAVGAGLIALVLCGLLGPVAGALGAPRPGSAAVRPEAWLESVLIQHRAFWRQAGQWSVPLLALVAVAGGVFRFAAAPGSALAEPEPAPLFEDLDGACGAVREQTFCFALARYAGGRLVARSDWMSIPIQEGKVEKEDGGDRLAIRAKAPDGVEWRFAFKPTEEGALHEGLIHVVHRSDNTVYTTWRSSFAPRLPPGMELPLLRGVPPLPPSAYECSWHTGRLQVDQLDLRPDRGLRAMRADFEHACLDGGGAWVAVGRFAFRQPGAREDGA